MESQYDLEVKYGNIANLKYTTPLTGNDEDASKTHCNVLAMQRLMRAGRRPNAHQPRHGNRHLAPEAVAASARQ